MKTKTKSKPSLKAKRAPAKAVVAEAKEEKKTTQQLQAVHDELTATPATEHLEEDVAVECPYCGEGFEIHVTSESDGQTMYEDCQVCCRPVSIFIHIEEGEFTVEAARS